MKNQDVLGGKGFQKRFSASQWESLSCWFLEPSSGQTRHLHTPVINGLQSPSQLKLLTKVKY